jgi:hypothetical protein
VFAKPIMLSIFTGTESRSATGVLMRKTLHGALIVGIVSVLLTACASKPAAAATTGAPSEAQSAWVACTHSIEAAKALPVSEAPRFSPASVTKMDDNDYIAVLFYQKSGEYYRCGVQKADDGTWKLTSLDSMQPGQLSVWGLKR